MQKTYYEELFKINNQNKILFWGWLSVLVTSFLKERAVYNKLPLKYKKNENNIAI